MWDVTTGEVLSTLQGLSKEIKSVCISRDGTKIVSGSEDSTVKVTHNACMIFNVRMLCID